MLGIKEVNSAIMFGEFSNAELNSILDAVKYARANLIRTNRRSLQVGDAVKFTSSRLGHTVTGTVRKVKKIFTPVGVSFKGGGFYKTDSRGGSSSSSSSSSTNSASTSTTSSESTSTPAAAPAAPAAD